VSVLETRGLGVCFRRDRQGRPLTPALARLRRSGGQTWGLRGVDLTLEEGEGVALIGPSGSGKSTLLRVLAGIHPADEGTVEVRRRVAPLLSVEAGLMSPLTGRENAELLAVLGGATVGAARAGASEVRERAGLEEAFDRPVAGWSQGMRARLGFAVADVARAELVLLDEVHEAFDHEFRAVLELRAHEVLGAGGAIVAAGHDHPMLARLCTRAVWLDGGRVADDGPFEDVRERYVSRRT
jgi:ABC-2 type transport system ATP-binding protein